jgi:hypothetical protein
MLEVYCTFLKFNALLFIPNEECPFKLEDGTFDWERFDPLLPEWIRGGRILDDGEYYRVASEFITDNRLEPLPPGVECYDEDERYMHLRLYLPEPNKEV